MQQFILLHHVAQQETRRQKHIKSIEQRTQREAMLNSHESFIVSQHHVLAFGGSAPLWQTPTEDVRVSWKKVLSSDVFVLV